MKTIYHVPTEQFGFIELEIEHGDSLAESDITRSINYYKAISEAVKAPTTTGGLTDKQLDDVIKKMMLGISVVGGTELWSQATPAQKLEINRVKRLLKQIKAKGIDEHAEEALSDIG